MFKVGPVFEANYELVQDQSFCIGGIAINQGGTDSGKTTAIMQVLCTIAVFERAPKEDAIITIVSKTIPDSKKGAYRKFEELVANNDYLRSKILDWNKTDRTVYWKSGWIMEFTSYMDEQSAKQGKRQYLFVNEAQAIPWPIFWQLAKKTRKVTFIDYNPSAPFWAHEKLIGTVAEGNDLSAPVKLIISDHRHNPFLSDADHARTENIKDEELWKVYARGLTGNVSGLIYPNWKQIPDKDYPWKDDSYFGGLDFGYTNDPTAGSKMVVISNKVFVHELCYEPDIKPVRLCALYKGVGFDEDRPIYCEHDPDMIRQLRQLDMRVIQARKGPGSIKAGISKVNEYEVYYTASSKNIHYERSKYMWMKDPDTGKFINVPTEVDNHHMDEIRYGIYTHFYRAA